MTPKTMRLNLPRRRLSRPASKTSRMPSDRMSSGTNACRLFRTRAIVSDRPRSTGLQFKSYAFADGEHVLTKLLRERIDDAQHRLRPYTKRQRRQRQGHELYIFPQ